MKQVFRLFKKHRILRFGLSGSLGFSVHIFVLFVLVNYFYVFYLVATSLAFLVSATTGYFLQKLFTFKHKSKNSIKQFSVYLGISSGMFFLNILMMYVFVDILGIMYIFSQVLACAFNAILSYLILSKFIFKDKTI